MKNIILAVTLLISPAVFAGGIHSFSNQEALKKTLDTPDLNKQLRQLMQDAELRDLQLVSVDINRKKDTFSIVLGYEGRKVVQASNSKGKPSQSKEIVLKYGVVATLEQSIKKVAVGGGATLEESYLTEPELDLIAADGEE